MGRQSIADPETPNKAKAGCFTNIRTCVGCLHGCDANVNLEKSGTCELNPIIGHESEAEYQTVMTDSPKNVLVIGAGPAGLEAAIGAAKRGHHVTVYDKDRWAGGKYRLASVPPCKGELGAFIVWQMHELNLRPRHGSAAKYTLLIRISSRVLFQGRNPLKSQSSYSKTKPGASQRQAS